MTRQPQDKATDTTWQLNTRQDKTRQDKARQPQDISKIPNDKTTTRQEEITRQDNR